MSKKRRDWIVGWWDEKDGQVTNRGHSGPLTETEAEQVRRAHRYSDPARHAVKQKRRVPCA